MVAIATKEGYLSFSHPSSKTPYKTWYRIYGDLATSKVTPLVTLHGGPGIGSDYVWPLADLYLRYGVPVICYDQIGCGRSTHLPDRNGDTEFWTAEIFILELDNLLEALGLRDNFDLYGQSWGGMLGSLYASRRPVGLRKLILSNSPASMALWIQSCDGLREKLPKDIQDTLVKHEKNKTFDNKEYKDAVHFFYERHVCCAKPYPQLLDDLDARMEEDPTVYHTMNGPSEFTIIGSLKTWSTIEECKNINVPTLLINGQHDEGQILCVAPFFNNIPKVRWITMDHCSHLPMFEDRERYMEIMGDFLSQ